MPGVPPKSRAERIRKRIELLVLDMVLLFLDIGRWKLREMVMDEDGMKSHIMNRKAFLNTSGKMGACTCLCAASSSVHTSLFQEGNQTRPGEKTMERAVKRMEYADHWVKRFFDVMDRTLDEETRKRLMMANGIACYKEWIRYSKAASVASLKSPCCEDIPSVLSL
jgi:hypothetical protein